MNSAANVDWIDGVANNARLIHEYGPLTAEIRERCADLRDLIEMRTRIGIPAEGDAMVATGPANARYENAHLERKSYYAEPLSGCTRADRPHISYPDGHVQASGGYWFGVDPADLTHDSERLKMFWTWARQPCACGGVYFLARVNVWRYYNEGIY